MLCRKRRKESLICINEGREASGRPAPAVGSKMPSACNLLSVLGVTRKRCVHSTDKPERPWAAMRWRSRGTLHRARYVRLSGPMAAVGARFRSCRHGLSTRRCSQFYAGPVAPVTAHLWQQTRPYEKRLVELALEATSGTGGGDSGEQGARDQVSGAT